MSRLPSLPSLPGARFRVPRPGFPWSAPLVPRGYERPPAAPHTGADYDTAWARRPLARHVRLLVLEGPIRLGVRALTAPERTGLDRLDGLEGAAIFAANHHSHLDTPLLLTSLPEPWRHRVLVAAAADYFFTNRLTSAASALAIGAIPIERTRIERRSADRAAGLIDDGWSLLIFPEGGRSADGWGRGHRGGAAYLALRTAVPVVPIHVEGTGAIFGKGDKRPTPGTSRVTFGAPLHPRDGESATRFAGRIETAVAALADEATTDWWSARQRAARGTSPSLSGPEGSSWRRTWALGERRRPRRSGSSRSRSSGAHSPAWPRI
ncbi:MAG: 1-acyl-sn-glycerol-3-phosphate acyltransferase [Actinobacteria bacterium]|nr:1-acyl-sn-glycerol-3-phosphate acyltransferase [Actinomycetota bacterium]